MLHVACMYVFVRMCACMYMSCGVACCWVGLGCGVWCVVLCCVALCCVWLCCVALLSDRGWPCPAPAGQPERALELFERSVAIREKAFGKNSASLAPTLCNLSTLYEAEKKYDVARSYLER